MNNELQIYKFAPGMNLRTVVIDGEPWYVAKDVCASLGFRDASNATRGLGSDKKTMGKVSTLGGSQSQTLISESGLYTLIFRSNKPEARQFTHWVTSVVLPAIRRDGGYVMGEEMVATGEMSMEDMIAKVKLVLETKIQHLARERASVTAELMLVTPY
jgi:prophage antirepressor-like protein